MVCSIWILDSVVLSSSSNCSELNFHSSWYVKNDVLAIFTFYDDWNDCMECYFSLLWCYLRRILARYPSIYGLLFIDYLFAYWSRCDYIAYFIHSEAKKWKMKNDFQRGIS